ncbi:uncharacterized protein LOC102364839 [Latimeria chalumnae]|uniref:uncharacterized protein LOC102364839 n=1 Tax=Latimeria chalumnae TaxID=7897 RepID=UPI0003C141E7
MTNDSSPCTNEGHIPFSVDPSSNCTPHEIQENTNTPDEARINAGTSYETQVNSDTPDVTNSPEAIPSLEKTHSFDKTTKDEQDNTESPLEQKLCLPCADSVEQPNDILTMVHSSEQETAQSGPGIDKTGLYETSATQDNKSELHEKNMIDSQSLDYTTALQQWQMMDNASKFQKSQLAKSTSRVEFKAEVVVCSRETEQNGNSKTALCSAADRDLKEVSQEFIAEGQQRADSIIPASQQVQSPLATCSWKAANPGSLPNSKQGVSSEQPGGEGLFDSLTGGETENSSPVGEAKRIKSLEADNVESVPQAKEQNQSCEKKESENLEGTAAVFLEKQTSFQRQDPTRTKTLSQRSATMELDNNEHAYDNMSDSGVSADFSPGSTLEMPSEPPRNETPIEREIRLLMEREESLRKSRGMAKPRTTEEYVEIKMKPILTQPSGTPVHKQKDRQLAEFQMQKEIQMEAKREEDLIQLGKVKGTYDKGTAQELLQKKKIFEQKQEAQNSEPASFKKFSEVPKVGVHSTPLVQHGTQANGLLSTNKGPSFAEINDKKVIILEHGFVLHPTPSKSVPTISSSQLPQRSNLFLEGEKVTVLETSSVFASCPSERSRDSFSPQPSTTDAVQENPFYKLRSKNPQSIVDQDIQDAQEREKELRRLRHSVYGSQAFCEASEHKKTPNGVEHSNSLPVRPSLGKLDITWPPPMQNNDLKQQDMEVERSPKAPRQRSALLQRWESRQFANRQEEDEE